MNVGEKIVVGGNEWTLESASGNGVLFLGRMPKRSPVAILVDGDGVTVDYAKQFAYVPIEVVEAAIRIWKELNA